VKILIALALLCSSLPAFSQTPKAAEKTWVVEYYYKTKWGHANEFWDLFKKNHLPILKRQIELGRIVSVKAEKPTEHMTEDCRWDYRVTITWKNVTTSYDDFDDAALAKQMYPDQATFEREEQRRFEILLAHWDLPISTMDLSAK
jgi:hypothetical protein